MYHVKCHRSWAYCGTHREWYRCRRSIFSKFFGEYLKTKEQHKNKKYTLAGGTLNNFQKLHTKCLEDNKVDLNEYNKLKQTYDVYKNSKTKLIRRLLF